MARDDEGQEKKELPEAMFFLNRHHALFPTKPELLLFATFISKFSHKEMRGAFPEEADFPHLSFTGDCDMATKAKKKAPAKKKAAAKKKKK